MPIINVNRKKLLIKVVIALSLVFDFFLITNVIVFASIPSTGYADLKDVPETEAALILGAKVFSDGRLSSIMKDRADSGLELYKAGKVKKLLVSGDHGTKNYDEVNTVKDYLLSRGLRADDLFLDHAGFDTYDSLYRARDIFQLKSVIVVTQKFHQPRALYIGKSLNLEVYGYIADKQEYQGMVWNELRECVARSKAVVDVVTGAKPKFLGEPIPIEGDSKLSWD